MAAFGSNLSLPQRAGERRRYAAVTARVRANLAERRRVLRQTRDADAFRHELHCIHALDTQSRRELATLEARPLVSVAASFAEFPDVNLHR